MNWIVYHIVSGHSFFTGIILLIVAALASTRTRPILNRITVPAFIIGVSAVAVSSTAIPYWCYALASVATAAWIASRFRRNWRQWASYSVVAVWLVAGFIEVPHHLTPSLARAGDRTIAIIGDSVTAGLDGDETSETWPSILAREHQLQVEDVSQMGATAASALKRARLQPITARVVVVEIGGNDVLGSTTSAQFAHDLDALLAYLARADRQVVMFELPLPPFFHEYGRVQREVAAKHHVHLVPRRVFLSVIAGSNSTLDSIHLSQTGHEAMADCVWKIVKSAFEKQTAG